jgi:3-demethylubiquinone-9 3-methyltransferase
MVKPAKNTICLWYDKDAEDAARFYAETFPDSSFSARSCGPGDLGRSVNYFYIIAGSGLHEKRTPHRECLGVDRVNGNVGFDTKRVKADSPTQPPVRAFLY